MAARATISVNIASQQGKHDRMEEKPYRSRLQRIYELLDSSKDIGSARNYFRNFEEVLSNGKTPFPYFKNWEDILQTLDADNWIICKSKAVRYVTAKDAMRRDWHQLFDALVEARAYKYLRDEGYGGIHFIEEQPEIKAPDLEAFRDKERILCEVKSINRSNDALAAKQQPFSQITTSITLNEGFITKLESHFNKARCQMKAADPNNEALHQLFINVSFDDFVGDCQELYYDQIDAYLGANPHPDFEVVIYNDRNLFGRQFVMKNATLINPPCV
jgi:hypothetical protein